MLKCQEDVSSKKHTLHSTSKKLAQQVYYKGQLSSTTESSHQRQKYIPKAETKQQISSEGIAHRPMPRLAKKLYLEESGTLSLPQLTTGFGALYLERLIP